MDGTLPYPHRTDKHTEDKLVIHLPEESVSRLQVNFEVQCGRMDFSAYSTTPASMKDKFSNNETSRCQCFELGYQFEYPSLSFHGPAGSHLTVNASP